MFEVPCFGPHYEQLQPDQCLLKLWLLAASTLAFSAAFWAVKLLLLSMAAFLALPYS